MVRYFINRAPRLQVRRSFARICSPATIRDFAHGGLRLYVVQALAQLAKNRKSIYCVQTPVLVHRCPYGGATRTCLMNYLVSLSTRKNAVNRGSRSDRPRYYTPHALDTVAAAGLGRTPRRTSCRASSQLMTSQWKSRPTITAHRSILIGRRSRYSITRVPHILH